MDNVLLKRLSVLGSATWFSENRAFIMTVGFAVVGSCGAAAFKFVCKVRGAGSTDPKQFFSLLLV